ncbi:MAG TPA: GntG family PLP-dependent aldolase [Bryobacteraceae bacterium]|jgi:threonine aldolase|nr:GntG family PLP-dependent aldolase [Bryobacteraceae bacterium]
MIDLRSDTVTKPTAAMRRAMAEAEVGDDVYGEDPTVRKLEERVAELLGKQASLFLPSGTMGNTIGIKLHTRHGEEVVCDHRAHILDWEMSMMAWFSGCLARPVPTADGVLRWADIEPVVRPRGTGFPAPTAMVNLEHPHNMGGGTLFSTGNLDTICDRAHERGLKVHMDGARLFNAVAASGETAARIVAKTDTVMFCLSKGLGAPVGSMLAGDAATMAEARLYRKRLGGGMRQAGILAAAGLVALEDASRARLCDDHANARLMAERIGIDPGNIKTNIVIFDIAKTGLTPADFLARLKADGILAGSVGGTRIRLVTHYDVSREDCVRAAEAIARLLA